MMIDPRDGRLYIVSKEVAGGVYAAPEELDPDGENTLERIDSAPLYATDAAFAPDGSHYAIRTYWGATFYDAADGVPGRSAGRIRPGRDHHQPHRRRGRGGGHHRNRPTGPQVLTGLSGRERLGASPVGAGEALGVDLGADRLGQVHLLAEGDGRVLAVEPAFRLLIERDTGTSRRPAVNKEVERDIPMGIAPELLLPIASRIPPRDDFDHEKGLFCGVGRFFRV